MTGEPELLAQVVTAQEAAGIIGRAVSTVHRYHEIGRLPHVAQLPGRTGSKLFDRTVVEALAAELDGGDVEPLRATDYGRGVPFDVVIRVHEAMLAFAGEDFPASEMAGRLDAMIAAATAVRAITSDGDGTAG